MRTEIDTGSSPRLYIRNPEWDPPKASENVETALNKFREQMTKTQAKFQKISRPNITCLQNFALRNLANHKKFITIWADKNMGVVIMLRDAYIKQCIKEHLGNTQVYENITGKHKEKIEELNSKFDNFVSNNKKVLGHQTLTFFNRNHKIYGDNIVCFRTTAKGHKHPVKLRPIVAKVGTLIESVNG